MSRSTYIYIYIYMYIIIYIFHFEKTVLVYKISNSSNKLFTFLIYENHRQNVAFRYI